MAKDVVETCISKTNKKLFLCQHHDWLIVTKNPYFELDNGSSSSSFRIYIYICVCVCVWVVYIKKKLVQY